MIPQEQVWNDCYDENWKGIIVPEAFTHPAKFSRALIRRIYEHARKEGWIAAGSYILDPFGGVALGGLDAMSLGLHWRGIELEEKFLKLGEQNIAKWQKDLQGWHNLGTARIVQGDSRNLAPGNLANMKEGEFSAIISSPPYAETPLHDDQRKANDRSYKLQGTKEERGEGYGQSSGQLGSMKEGPFDLCVSSPPYEEGLGHGMKKIREIDVKKGLVNLAQSNYGGSKGNIGHESGNTFWFASKEIVRGCYDLLRPGGHSIWVCKDYIKKGQRVPFSDRWTTLCESVGFKPVCRHKAMLVKDHGVIPMLDGSEELVRTERKSFFRRLHEKKYPDLKIDWEDVLCFVK